MLYRGADKAADVSTDRCFPMPRSHAQYEISATDRPFF